MKLCEPGPVEDKGYNDNGGIRLTKQDVDRIGNSRNGEKIRRFGNLVTTGDNIISVQKIYI